MNRSRMVNYPMYDQNSAKLQIPQRNLITSNPVENIKTARINAPQPYYRIDQLSNRFGEITKNNLITENPVEFKSARRLVAFVGYAEIDYNGNMAPYNYNFIPPF